MVVNASSLWMNKEFCPGYRLGKFRGKGGFASVWEGRKDDGRTVALKFLPAGDNLSAAREIRSIQIVRQLRHPNLVRIDEVWCHRGYVVITMELADGSLLDLLEAYQSEFKSPLAPHDVCQYLKQAALALDYMNARRHRFDGAVSGIQHCDVKPTNILLFGETAKLSDFGLASITNSPVQFHRRAGTFEYSAPEVFQGKLTDRMDQYSLAVTYCHLRTGQLPFPSVPHPLPPNYVRPTPDLTILPLGERPIVARALAGAPQDRWPSCLELINQLTRQLK